MKKYSTSEIYNELHKRGYTPLRLREGIHVFDDQNRIVAQYKRTLSGDYFWDIWPSPSSPLRPEQHANAYPLTEDALFLFSTVEGTEKDKRNALVRIIKNFNSIT